MTMLNTIRHNKVFSAEQWKDLTIDIIGAGAVGGKIALGIAKLGLNNIRIWDFDKVESHNVPNQICGIHDIGVEKVAMVKKEIEHKTGTKIKIENRAFDYKTQLGEVVFLCVDSMNVRKEIFEKSLKYKGSTFLVIETRMGSDIGRIYTLNPGSPSQIKFWEQTLCTDEEATPPEIDGCGASISVGPVSDIVAGLATLLFMKKMEEFKKGGNDTEAEVLMALSTKYPLNLMCQTHKI